MGLLAMIRSSHENDALLLIDLIEEAPTTKVDWFHGSPPHAV